VAPRRRSGMQFPSVFGRSYSDRPRKRSAQYRPYSVSCRTSNRRSCGSSRPFPKNVVRCSGSLRSEPLVKRSSRLPVGGILPPVASRRFTTLLLRSLVPEGRFRGNMRHSRCAGGRSTDRLGIWSNIIRTPRSVYGRYGLLSGDHRGQKRGRGSRQQIRRAYVIRT
jgi:hypothetical protein